MERFWSKVIKSDGCWEWHTPKPPPEVRNRYPKFSLNGVQENANRVAWMLIHGKIPRGMCVLHHCDNTHCVRPDHLFLGTKADNLHDAQEKGRFPISPRRFKQRRRKVQKNEVAKARDRLGMTGEEFARFLGFTTARATRHWEEGTRSFHGPAEVLLKLALKHPELLDEIKAISGQARNRRRS